MVYSGLQRVQPQNLPRKTLQRFFATPPLIALYADAKNLFNFKSIVFWGKGEVDQPDIFGYWSIPLLDLTPTNQLSGESGNWNTSPINTLIICSKVVFI